MQLRGSSCSLSCCVSPPSHAQQARDSHADQMADKLWWIIDITKEYQPPFQAHVIPGSTRWRTPALTLQGERARTLVHDDVIELEPQARGPIRYLEQAMGCRRHPPPRHVGQAAMGGVSGQA